MPKFNVYAMFSASKHLGEIEADTKEEAKEKAWDVFVQELSASLCHHCADEIELNPDCHDIEVEELS